MSDREKISRRAFIRRAGLTAAAAPLILPGSSLGSTGQTAPSERLTLGIIGLKKMGRAHVYNLLGFRNVQLVAVCDVDRAARDEQQQRINEHYAAAQRDGKYAACDAYNEYEKLLARDDIDAVVIATPEHWHAIMAIHAASAGKDVYCEKPLALTIREARAMVDTVRLYGTVFQTGSQQRSSGNFRFACELVRSGYIGELRGVHVGVGPPSSHMLLPAEPIPEGLDYDRWLGPAPWAPYNKLRCGSYYEDGWRRIRDYSGGKMTDWGAHHFDIAQWGLGMDDSGPVEIIPPDGKDVEHLTYLYANGIRMIKDNSNGVVFVGSEGKVEVNRGHLRTWPETLKKQPLRPGDVHLYKSPGHYADWFDCIRDRRRPLCDVEIGCRSATVCHLGNIAMWTGRPLKWDPQAEQIIGDESAARWLDRPKRAPYRL